MIRCIRIEENMLGGTLHAFVELELTKAGLIIRDCGWHKFQGQEWVTFPRRVLVDRNAGSQPLIEIRDPYLKDQFQAEALKAIHAFLPQEGRREYGKGKEPEVVDVEVKQIEG